MVIRRDQDDPRPKVIIDGNFCEDGWNNLMQLIAQHECITTVPAEAKEDFIAQGDMSANILSDTGCFSRNQLTFDFMV